MSRDHAVPNFPDRSWRRNHWNMQRVFRLFFVHGHDSGQLMTSLDRTRTLRQIPTEDKPNEIIVRSCVRISKEKDARWKWQQQNDIGTTRRCPNDQSWRWQWLPSLENSLLFENQFLLPVLISCSLLQKPGMASRRCTVASYLLNDHLQHAGSVTTLKISLKSLKKQPPKKCDWSKHFVDGLWHVGIRMCLTQKWGIAIFMFHLGASN